MARRVRDLMTAAVAAVRPQTLGDPAREPDPDSALAGVSRAQPDR